MKIFLVFLLFITSTSYADKIIILDDPVRSLESRVELIMNAKKTIDVQYFTVKHDYISISGLALLRDAARRGVKVRMIVDSMDNRMTREMMGAFLNNLDTNAEKNIEIKEFNQFNIFRPFCYSRRMHDKSIIIDNEYLIVGDRNVASGYYDIPENDHGEIMPSYHGTDALLYGSKSIGEAKNYFEQRWNSRDVKNVKLYEYSQNELDYSYCSYQISDGDALGCEMRRQTAVDKIKVELEKLDKHYSFVTQKNSKILEARPLLKALETAYETDDISFVHDDAARRVCKGKNPEFNMGKTLYQTIAENTEKELIVISPYLIVTPEMENLIKYLVIEKNVFVKFITNSAESNDQPVATAGYLATRSRLMNILNKNTGQKIRIYEYQNLSNPQLTDGNGKILIAGKAIDTIHAKVVLMDNKKAYVGSYNWDYRSQNLNSEIGVIMALDGSKFAGPAKDLRNRAAIMLKTSNIVQPNGTTNGEEKVSLALTELEKKQLDTIMKERREAVKFWEKLLSLPIVGELLLNQL